MDNRRMQEERTMGAVVTWVSGRIAAERQQEVAGPYAQAIASGPPPGIDQTMLIRDGDEMGIVTVWTRREDLEAAMTSNEEPLARRLIRQAGGTPSVRVFEVVARS